MTDELTKEYIAKLPIEEGKKFVSDICPPNYDHLHRIAAYIFLTYEYHDSKCVFSKDDDLWHCVEGCPLNG